MTPQAHPWRVPRLFLNTVLVVASLLWMAFYATTVRMVFEKLSMNDFGKFYFATRQFIDGRDMYAPNPATLVPVSPTESRQFLDLNPPHLHLLVLPVAWLAPLPAFAAWAVVNLAALAASVLILLRRLQLRVRLKSVPLGSFLFLSFAGSLATAVTGQLSFLLLLGSVLAWRAACDREWSRAGRVLGIMASVKPFLLLFLPYFLLRRDSRAAGSFAVCAVAPFAVGLLVFGGSAHASWLAALGSANWAWPPMNGSILGFLSRTLSANPMFQCAIDAPGLLMPIWVGACVVVVAISTQRMRQRPDPAPHRDLALVSLAALLISPLGWVYYLWIALPPCAALAASMPRLSRRQLALAAVLLVTSCWPLFLTRLGQPSPFATPTIGSAYFWATLLLWGAVLGYRSRMGAG